MIYENVYIYNIVNKHIFCVCVIQSLFFYLNAINQI